MPPWEPQLPRRIVALQAAHIDGSVLPDYTTGRSPTGFEPILLPTLEPRRRVILRLTWLITWHIVGDKPYNNDNDIRYKSMWLVIFIIPPAPFPRVSTVT